MEFTPLSPRIGLRALRRVARSLGRRCNSRQSRPSPAVAVLFQDIEPPIINGVRKPRKPGGYKDSGADIAFNLRAKGVKVVTSDASPSNTNHEGWCFSDTTEGILSAVQKGATHLWANTILFNSHPLQASEKLNPYASDLCVVGQPPGLVENFDDKAYLNGKLRELGGFTLPRAWMIDELNNLDSVIQSIDQFPVVGKPIRGRGSHGVKVCRDEQELRQHIQALSQESPSLMIEEFLAGEETTITVMPPSPNRPEYWSMPPVVRFNHADGIAPYNGVVAVTANSRTISQNEMSDPAFSSLMRQCEQVAKIIGATAPIRIDARRFGHGTQFALFDINMKPNMTGPGRPGREDQASLTALAAAAIGWDYPTLLQNVLRCEQPLQRFRDYKSPF